MFASGTINTDNRLLLLILLDFPGGSGGKESACKARDPDLIPGSERSPGVGNGNPFQYSCLENPMDGGAWWTTSPWDHKELDTIERLTGFSLISLKLKWLLFFS